MQRIAIIGIGMIGGSFAAALRARAHPAVIAAFSPGGDAARARELGLVDEVYPDAASAVRGADWVVLAAPVPALPALFREIRPVLGAATRITDCGSTKASVVQAARAELGEAFDRFVAGHPLAGSERSGPDAANPDLFRGKRWLLCPVSSAQQAHCADLRALLAPTGAVVSEIDPREHDRILAEVSHWPHAVAFALGAAIARGDLADQAIEFSAGGLRDTSRIAASSPELWAGILLDNLEPVLESGERFQAELDGLLRALRERDRPALIESLSLASRWRKRLG